METEIQNERWGDLFNKQKSQSTTDNLLKLPEKISSYIFIYDCFANSILYVNSSFESMTGYNAAQFNLNFLIDMIHPEDQPYFFSCEERGLEFTNSLNFNEHFKFKMSYSYRIRTADNSYILIQQECQALEVNESGHLTKTLVIHKRKEDNTERAKDDYKIFDRSRNIYINDENCYNLSKREFEILNLIKDGKSSAEIAESLFVSKNTILTHRKNILNKTNSSSFLELISKISYTHE